MISSPKNTMKFQNPYFCCCTLYTRNVILCIQVLIYISDTSYNQPFFIILFYVVWNGMTLKLLYVTLIICIKLLVAWYNYLFHVMKRLHIIN